ncbi:MAG: acetyl-CoA carboxylase biotin carboxylase subunit [Chloroflexaceae bacterium]|nr:acetyl-CoA carboxylase biotin carboxylase subunit [Chloroflexaceae bacterium]
MLKKVLVANRGEIALRIVRACRDLGIKAVVAYSEADQDSLAVRVADEAVCIGPATPSRSYLNPASLISAAVITGCDAVHPGYGFLAENAYFSEIVAECGLKFVGPHANAIRMMGDKASGRATMQAAGVPIVPGSDGNLINTEHTIEMARKIGYPVMLKPSGGGGGRGMRVAFNESELVKGYQTARAEAEAAFGRGDLLMEKYLPRIRHVEIQVLGDNYGNLIHLGERDCSAQRRHQKIVEESPSPGITAEIREKMGRDATRGVSAINYNNAGTLEFLVDPDGNYYFIEMNTRVQVEHPVTELVSGVDIVKWQLLIAGGEPLSIRQEDVKLQGHAIECRINAEDPERDFLPVAGKIDFYLPPGGPGVRVDSHMYTGYVPPRSYDSLLGKIITWGQDRDEAVARMQRALQETIVAGLKTTIPFQIAMFNDPVFRSGDISTRYVAEMMERWKAAA